MAKLEWNESLSIGVPAIDEQHRTWIGHMDALAQAMAARVGLVQITQTLDFLIDYTDFHFSAEEGQMTASAYPGFGEHHRKHNELKATLSTLLRDYDEDGATHRLVGDVSDFLRAWLVTHIRDEDQRFGAFLKERGLATIGAQRR
ncbi:MAG: bacteriohemerythrin [Bacteroidales bacterium]